MKLHELYPYPSERKNRKRRGRGAGSGLGCTAGKGNKGQKARAGNTPALGFEGGQMPLIRRVPKRGFKNPFSVRYFELNLRQIEAKFADRSEISLEDLYSICSKRAGSLPIKVLAQGELSGSKRIEAHKFSKSAAEKIRQAGGQAVSLEG